MSQHPDGQRPPTLTEVGLWVVLLPTPVWAAVTLVGRALAHCPPGWRLLGSVSAGYAASEAGAAVYLLLNRKVDRTQG